MPEMNRILQNKRRQILETADHCGARRARVFGPVARGTAHPGSDLDVLVGLENGRTLLDIVALKQDLEGILGLSVDVVTEESLSPYIRDDVLREAIDL